MARPKWWYGPENRRFANPPKQEDKRVCRRSEDCNGCPFPASGFICWGDNGECMRTRFEKMKETDTTKLVIRQDEDLCTLITCYPTGVNTHRLLVQAERIPYETAEEIVEEIVIQEEKPQSNWEDQYMLGVWLGIWAMLLVLAIYLTVLLIRRNCRKKKGGRYVRNKQTKKLG